MERNDLENRYSNLSDIDNKDILNAGDSRVKEIKHEANADLKFVKEEGKDLHKNAKEQFKNYKEQMKNSDEPYAKDRIDAAKRDMKMKQDNIKENVKNVKEEIKEEKDHRIDSIQNMKKKD